MITKQTIELNDNERLALQKALGIIDNLAEIVKVSKDSVFDYLCKVAVFDEDVGEIYIKAIHNIDEIKEKKSYDNAFDKVKAELHATAEMHEDGSYYLRDEWIDEYFDKYYKA